MEKGKIRMIAALLVTALVLLCSCGSGADGSASGSPSSDSGSGSSEAGSEKESAEVELLDSGYSVEPESGSWYIRAGAVYQNRSKEYAYEYPTVTVTAYDKDGNVVGTEDGSAGTVQPEEKQAMAILCECREKPAKVKFEMDTGDRTGANSGAVTADQLEVSGEKKNTDDTGDTMFTGQVTNHSKIDLDSVETILVLKKGKKIVYADDTSVDNVKAGKTKAYSFDEFTLPEYDSYEVYVYNGMS